MGEGSKETNGKKLFLQNEGGYRDGLKHKKGRDKGWLCSNDTQTPSLYLCYWNILLRDYITKI